MNSSLELSVVIPAYNEEQRLPRTIGRIREYLHRLHPASEIIVVDDASSDRTGEIVRSLQKNIPELRLLAHHDRNHGKGRSVRTGMLEARGNFSLFTDADLSAPIEEAEKLLAALNSADIAIGSRALDRSLIQVHQSRARELSGIFFNRIVRLATGLPFADTQCGFKAFRTARSRIIFEQQRIEDFGFDPEILFLARRHGLRAVEVPVVWSHEPGTKIRMFRDSARMFTDLLKIRWNAARGRYPQRAAGA
ncbi:MAG TPA: dolichyl-phosphate beta-glucosyltransferase [Candidatus Acidoferrales bacterium]|nr:dolichyl-phosphate beta-glucosyltransferase [Candidatus Acidoferrales bacterium]